MQHLFQYLHIHGQLLLYFFCLQCTHVYSVYLESYISAVFTLTEYTGVLMVTFFFTLSFKEWSRSALVSACLRLFSSFSLSSSRARRAASSRCPEEGRETNFQSCTLILIHLVLAWHEMTHKQLGFFFL